VRIRRPRRSRHRLAGGWRANAACSARANVELDAFKPPTGFNLGGSFRDGEPNPTHNPNGVVSRPVRDFRLVG
jgi:hypothetical protein